MRQDLVLSSGFLAFARHVGFLRAVEEAGVEVDAVCGTSSGALVAALWAAGVPAEEIGRELSARPPIRWMRLSLMPWRGLFRIEPVIARLRQLLPATFAELRRPLGVGVMDRGNAHHLLTDGPLPEAVAASCAIPLIFQPVWLAGRRLSDGGAVDRLGLSVWRRWRPGRCALLHWVEGTRGKEPSPDLEGLRIVRTPPSGASFFNLKEFDSQVLEARSATAAAVADLGPGPA
jgi:predicted acylesterase/phospholipase RssA